MTTRAYLALTTLVLASCRDITGPTDPPTVSEPHLSVTNISTTGVTITDLGTVGGLVSHAYAINDRGQVTGTSACCGGPIAGGTRVFLWTEQEDMSIVNVYSPITSGFGINNLTQIVGQRFKYSPVGMFPFLWTPQDGVVDLGTLEGRADAVNVLGHVVGTSGGHAFYWTPEDDLIDLGTLLGGSYSFARDINDLNQVVGASDVAVGRHAFLWTAADGMIDLGTLSGGLYSDAYAINNRGQVVGYSSTPSGGRAFRWDANNGMVELPGLPGLFSSYARDINDAGNIVGSIYAPGSQHAILWTAQGEMFDLGTLPGHARSQATAINRQGVIVGVSWEQISQGLFAARAVVWNLH